MLYHTYHRVVDRNQNGFWTIKVFYLPLVIAFTSPLLHILVIGEIYIKKEYKQQKENLGRFDKKKYRIPFDIRLVRWPHDS